MSIHYLPNQRKPLPHEAALCGSMAGGFAGAISTPLDVVKTRVMLEAKVSCHSSHSPTLLAHAFFLVGTSQPDGSRIERICLVDSLEDASYRKRRGRQDAFPRRHGPGHLDIARRSHFPGRVRNGDGHYTDGARNVGKKVIFGSYTHSYNIISRMLVPISLHKLVMSAFI